MRNPTLTLFAVVLIVLMFLMLWMIARLREPKTAATSQPNAPIGSIESDRERAQPVRLSGDINIHGVSSGGGGGYDTGMVADWSRVSKGDPAKPRTITVRYRAGGTTLTRTYSTKDTSVYVTAKGGVVDVSTDMGTLIIPVASLITIDAKP
jgi:hypothetical protein